MELDDLIMLGACSLLGGTDMLDDAWLKASRIRRSVETAKEVWEEVLRQEREKC